MMPKFVHPWHAACRRFWPSRRASHSQIAKGGNVIIESGTLFHSPEHIRLGSDVYIGPDCVFYGFGGITIGSGTIIAHRVEIMTRNHRYDGADLESLPYDARYDLKSVVVSENVWIGSNVLIVPGVTVGEGAVIAMGAVVTKDVPRLAVVGGNPARVIKMRDAGTYARLKAEGRIYMKNRAPR